MLLIIEMLSQNDQGAHQMIQLFLSRRRVAYGTVGVFLTIVGLLGGALLPRALAQSAPRAAGARVVASTTVFGDMVKQVGGDRVAVRSIVPAGVDVEDYEPTPDDLQTLSQADLLVMNGLALDRW